MLRAAPLTLFSTLLSAPRCFPGTLSLRLMLAGEDYLPRRLLRLVRFFGHWPRRLLHPGAPRSTDRRPRPRQRRARLRPREQNGTEMIAWRRRGHRTPTQDGRPPRRTDAAGKSKAFFLLETAVGLAGPPPWTRLRPARGAVLGDFVWPRLVRWQTASRWSMRFDSRGRLPTLLGTTQAVGRRRESESRSPFVASATYWWPPRPGTQIMGLRGD